MGEDKGRFGAGPAGISMKTHSDPESFFAQHGETDIDLVAIVRGACLAGVGEPFRGFIAEYAELCNKHQVAVTGCSCCRNPWLAKIGGDFEDGEHIETVAKHIAHLIEGAQHASSPSSK